MLGKHPTLRAISKQRIFSFLSHDLLFNPFFSMDLSRNQGEAPAQEAPPIKFWTALSGNRVFEVESCSVVWRSYATK